jgi:Holliday junction resolvasome RuvABC endonuclease subunit
MVVPPVQAPVSRKLGCAIIQKDAGQLNTIDCQRLVLPQNTKTTEERARAIAEAVEGAVLFQAENKKNEFVTALNGLRTPTSSTAATKSGRA